MSLAHWWVHLSWAHATIVLILVGYGAALGASLLGLVTTQENQPW